MRGGRSVRGIAIAGVLFAGGTIEAAGTGATPPRRISPRHASGGERRERGERRVRRVAGQMVAPEPLHRDDLDSLRFGRGEASGPVAGADAVLDGDGVLAFALVLALEWADEFDRSLATTIRLWAVEQFRGHRDCQAWEPGGGDILEVQRSGADVVLAGAGIGATLPIAAFASEAWMPWLLAAVLTLAGAIGDLRPAVGGKLNLYLALTGCGSDGRYRSGGGCRSCRRCGGRSRPWSSSAAGRRESRRQARWWNFITSS